MDESVFRKRFHPVPKSSQIPTIADVARLAEVSIATVSRVLNGTTPVTDGTARRVQAAIEELKFVPRTAARVLASRKTNTIGLLLPEISGAFFPPLLRGIIERQMDGATKVSTSRFGQEIANNM